MSISPNSPWRGAAAFLRQPVTDEVAAQHMVETIYYFCTRCSVSTNLADIEFRSSDGEMDIRRHVFRWDSAPYEFVFQNGFEARRQEGTPDSMYYNLEHYVNSGGRPLDIRRNTTHAFVSTTIRSSWRPTINPGTARVYRYEIYAPGGIIVTETLGDLCRYPRQAEVAFPAGIAPQYVRSAQLFELTNNSSNHTHGRRVDNILYMNMNFNPQSHPERRIVIQRPIRIYRENNQTRSLLTRDFPVQQRRPVDANDDLVEHYTGGVISDDSYIDSALCSRRASEAYMLIQEELPERKKRSVDANENNTEGDSGFRSTRPNEVYMFIRGESPERQQKRSVDANDDLIEYYTEGVTRNNNYIDSAFRSTRPNEAYMFIQGEYVLIDYAPGTTGDKIIQGPKLIGDSFPSLVDTDFAEYGIDAALSCYPKSEAIIFSSNLCARIDYAPGTTDDKIIRGPKTIRQMFPFFKDTKFEKGVDAAFESTKDGEAFLFKSSEYALINYEKPELYAIRPIIFGFECLRGTEFASDIGAAFASHKENEAYLFKGNSYILLRFAPRGNDDFIVGGPKEIVPSNWPSLKDFVPRENIGFDVYEYGHDLRERAHDEL